MRPVPGFDRPLLQWIFVALGVALVAIATLEAIGLRRSRAAVEQLRVATLNGRLEREQLERRLSREQSARESFALEVDRLRGSVAPPHGEPTLTLTPLTARRPTPPDGTVTAPAPLQSIQLRLLLPERRLNPSSRYSVAVRSWSSGVGIWSRGELAPSAVDGRAAVVCRVSGDVLAPGAYEIAVSETTAGSSHEVAFYEVGVLPAKAK